MKYTRQVHIYKRKKIKNKSYKRYKTKGGSTSTLSSNNLNVAIIFQVV
jgi:hypothetical protein